MAIFPKLTAAMWPALLLRNTCVEKEKRDRKIFFMKLPPVVMERDVMLHLRYCKNVLWEWGFLCKWPHHSTLVHFLPGLWVIWGQCCPRVTAAPCLPNSPITQLSPYFTRKSGISIFIWPRIASVDNPVFRPSGSPLVHLYLPSLLVSSCLLGKFLSAPYPHIKNKNSFQPNDARMWIE